LSGEWFTETLHSGYGQSFEILETLVREKTAYQELTIFRTRALGRVLVLDGAVQTTEADEFYYHEMVAHLPLFSQQRPRRVLIIGGGDGGTLREVLKHPSVEHVTMVEIDERVVDLSRRYLPSLSDGAFDDPRGRLIIGDGTEFVARSADTYDVVIVDSTDPVGPSIPLFEEPFYRNCARLLDGTGVLIRQAGVPFFQKEEYRDTHSMLQNVFGQCAIALAAVPTYCGGHMALALGSENGAQLAYDQEGLNARYAQAGIETRYYTPEIHGAALTLPGFMKSTLGSTPPPIQN
jgi:spermidine synthase